MPSPRPAAWRPAALLAAGSVTAVLGRLVVRRRAAPAKPAPVTPAAGPARPRPPEIAAPPPGALALERFAGGSPVPLAVAEAYREARRAFNAAREHRDDAAYARLAGSAAVLWSCATLAEAGSPVAARTLARDARKLVRLLEERRDVIALREAVGGTPAASGELSGAEAHLQQRAELLEQRIVAHGKPVFASKPSRVAGRIADGR